MSNRKLAGALSILLLAVLFMTIGCGDGKRNSHTNLRKVNQGGKPGGDAKSIAEKSAKLTAIDNQMRAQAEAGELIGSESLEAGTYTLDEVMSYVKFIRGGDDLSAYTASKVTNGTLGAALASDQVGLIGGDTDEARLMEIPRVFTVQSMGAITPVSADKNVIYLAQLQNDGKMLHSLNNPTVQVELNLINRLGTRTGNTGGYVFELNGKRETRIEIRRIEGTTIRMVVSIQEKMAAKVGRQNSTITKKMILTYKAVRAAAPTAGLPPAGQQPPAPTAEGVPAPPAAPVAPAAPAAPAFGERTAAPAAPAAAVGPTPETEFPAGNPPVSQTDTAD